MAKIKQIFASEVLNSRGEPTIKAKIIFKIWINKKSKN